MRGIRNFILKFRYRLRGLFVKVDKNMVIFGAYNGKGYACSPKAVYEYMINEDRFAEYRYVWIFDEPEKYKFLENNKNTEVVKNKTFKCERYAQMAKYWIFNFRALDYWTSSDDQVYVQCWHGTPLKRLGYDITDSDNAMNSVREIHSKYMVDAKRFDYLISSCKFVTDKFSSAWNLKELGNNAIVIETGYPRNDFLNTYKEDDVIRIKKKLGLDIHNKKIILYAPTWRDNQHDSKNGYIYMNPVDFTYLQEQLSEEYILLFRAHYFIADNFDFEAYSGFIYNVSQYDDINELYIVSELLITDYSSVFFDYAILNRPMLFYMYDMEQYRDEIRGFYIDVNNLPGPVLKTEKELVDSIRKIDFNVDMTDKLKSFNYEYNLMNDGKATERLVNAVIKVD